MKLFGYIIVIGISLITLSLILNMCGDTANVIKNEYSASAMLKKYEYFKDMSAAIDSKRADIQIYETLLSKTDKKDDNYSQLQAELLGLIMIHNDLCSEYNSAMVKFNYAFCNKGTLPQTNLEVLPREFKPYINQIN